MPRRREINNPVSTELYSVQIFPDSFSFSSPDMNQEFEKWASVEVADFKTIPDDMECLIIPKGEYAVFHYKGSSSDPRIFNYIFGEWLYSSGFQIDNRPHFEILGEKYKNNDPESEEYICIPVK